MNMKERAWKNAAECSMAWIRRKNSDQVADLLFREPGDLCNLTDGHPKCLHNAIRELEEMVYPGDAASLERFSTDLLNYLASPQEHWKFLRTTNMLKRDNLEIKRISLSIGVYLVGDGWTYPLVVRIDRSADIGFDAGEWL